MPLYNDATRRLMNDQRLYLTDGGFETSMLFHEGLDLPSFAACVILDSDAGRDAMTRYFERYLGLAAAAGTGFVLDTNSWRSGVHWAPALNRSPADMLRLTGDAVDFAKELRADWSGRVSPILINGVVGPSGDGYAPDIELEPALAQSLHAPQIDVFAREGVDMVSALTMTHPGEAIGIARASVTAGLPVVISFTVETDGDLPNGQSLADTIAEVDAATDAAPIYYMVNCAHPEHFQEILSGGWTARIGGVRTNASRLSHAELDVAESLDEGDPEELGALHVGLARRLPGLRVVGGCCGTDHRHVHRIAETCLAPA
ncbi:homocysteine S-methyltransferase [Jannaschia faecimaris]|uniref:Homocysteine S-methyltransferase n=1 Tax=Jannaschia faecimaris TaxID=1244108 RepID=A0A1H3U6Y5_9RHOB|nr:homocysteine S-methyltransferase family protein [Jannaschia faecimaris]SDZ58118.1 homocysteine S-methyltransferase [Jannaschia faecimaris]